MSSNQDPLIQMKGIKKVFFTDEVETHALTNVHMTIQRGDYVSISGPSGCGKTTLLSILGLLDTPTDGERSRLLASTDSGPERAVIVRESSRAPTVRVTCWETFI